MLSHAVNEDAEASISPKICPSYRAQKEHGAESKSVSSVILVTAPLMATLPLKATNRELFFSWRKKGKLLKG